MSAKTLRNLYLKTIRFDIINKFPIKNTRNICKIDKIILNFGCKTSDVKKLSTALLALELISQQKGKLTTTNRPNLEAKIRKGDPVGCKITLRNGKAFDFIYETLMTIFSQLKSFEEIPTSSNSARLQNTLTYMVNDMFSFKELENNYQLFQHLPNLKITVVTNNETINQLLFALKSFKTPFVVKNLQI
jgi:large subunit ribosomal protein L5